MKKYLFYKIYMIKFFLILGLSVSFWGGSFIEAKALECKDAKTFSEKLACENTQTGLGASRQAAQSLGAEINPAYQTGTGRQTLYAGLGRILQVLLGFVGLILLGVILMGGYTWFTAGGDERKVEKARAWLKNGVIGMILISSAWVITSFVMQSLRIE